MRSISIHPVYLDTKNILKMAIIACLLTILTLCNILSAQAQTGTAHIVRTGESLSVIAQSYGVTASELAAANGINNYDIVRVGQTLVIPNGASGVVSQRTGRTQTGGKTVTIGRGDTLSEIAAMYGVSTSELMAHNGITNPDIVRLGQTLSIPASSSSVAPVNVAPDVPVRRQNSGLTHTVQAGDTLSSIASRYGISTATLMNSNGLTNANVVRLGQKLAIHGATILPAPPRFPGTINGGSRVIEVDLGDQTLTAWDGDTIFMDTLISSGNPWTPTVTGRYLIDRKYEQQRMTGPGYDFKGVPWIMYFWEGYAFHGAYWHNNFGQPMSHGCVNMTPAQAKQLYDWADYGTEVYIHY